MPPLTLRRKTAILALAVALALPWAAAAAPQARRQPSASGLLQQIWTVLTGLWTGVNPDDGCRMDPSGRCRAGSAPAPTITSDSGCRMDPNGRCVPGGAAPAPTITPDSGCRMDPSGGCLPGS